MKFKKTAPNKPKPDQCETIDCQSAPTCVLGGYWFCSLHGDRSYERKRR